MFNIFKKLHHSDNLIFANSDGNIILSKELPVCIKSITEDIIVNNMLYDDKVYKAIYKEYKKHHIIYDLHPLLLYFRIPILIQAQYVHRKLIEPTGPLPSITYISTEIPKHFRIPEFTKELILECLQKSSQYMATKEKVDYVNFERYLEFKFLSEWPLYIKKPDWYINEFSNIQFDKFIKAGGDNCNTISNIIERTLQSKIKEANSN